jgi:hypothetical protein
VAGIFVAYIAPVFTFHDARLLCEFFRYPIQHNVCGALYSVNIVDNIDDANFYRKQSEACQRTVPKRPTYFERSRRQWSSPFQLHRMVMVCADRVCERKKVATRAEYNSLSKE